MAGGHGQEGVVECAVNQQPRPTVIQAALVWLHDVIGIFVLPVLFLETVVVVVVIVECREIENGLVTQVLVQEKAIIADSKERQGGGGKQHALGIIQSFDCGIHRFFGVRPDAKECLKKRLVDAKLVLCGHVGQVPLLNIRRPRVILGLRADDGAPEGGFSLPG